MRRIRYRQAAIAFVFTSLWFVLGFLLLWSPLPGALGIRSMLLGAWLLLFFVMLAVAGAALMLAGLNGIFPSRARRARYSSPPAGVVAPGRRPDGRGAGRAKQHGG
ncbi:MAG: hypothetical protein IVW36_09445 [Dehalococcoidia bacterium]|nr:hypothetical protein [Dehalococcoidia bacterium]